MPKAPTNVNDHPTHPQGSGTYTMHPTATAGEPYNRSSRCLPRGDQAADHSGETTVKGNKRPRKSRPMNLSGNYNRTAGLENWCRRRIEDRTLLRQLASIVMGVQREHRVDIRHQCSHALQKTNVAQVFGLHAYDRAI